MDLLNLVGEVFFFFLSFSRCLWLLGGASLGFVFSSSPAFPWAQVEDGLYPLDGSRRPIISSG